MTDDVSTISMFPVSLLSEREKKRARKKESKRENVMVQHVAAAFSFKSQSGSRIRP